MQHRRRTFGLMAALTITLLVAVQGLSLAQNSPIEVEFFREELTSDTAVAHLRIAALFMEENPDIKIKFTVASSSNYTAALTTRIIAGEAPEISNLVGTLVPEFAEKGLLQDINVYAEKNGVVLDRLLLPMAIDYGKWRGVLYAAPVMVQPFATYFNVAFFEEAGVASPIIQARSGNWNWDTMANAARHLTRDLNGDGAIDRWGVAHGAAATSRVNVFINTAGGSFIQPNPPPFRSALNTPEVLKAFEFLNRMINEWRVMPPPHGRTNATRFETGNSSMTFEGPWQIGTNRVNRLAYEWDVAPIPRGPDNDGSNIHIGSLQMPLGSKNPDAAWKYIHFVLTDPRAADIYMRVTGRPHANLAFLPQYFRIQEEEGNPKNVRVLGDMLMHPRSVPMIPSWPAQTELAAVLESRLKAAYEGKLAMAIALQLAHEEWNVIFDNFNKQN